MDRPWDYLMKKGTRTVVRYSTEFIDDEINLEPGLRFYRIQAEDDQGWCLGRLEDGTEGFYPANHVMEI